MSKSKYSGRLRQMSGAKNDPIPLKSDPSKFDAFPTLSPPTFDSGDVFGVDKSMSKSSQKLRRWLTADSSSEARLI